MKSQNSSGLRSNDFKRSRCNAGKPGKKCSTPSSSRPKQCQSSDWIAVIVGGAPLKAVALLSLLNTNSFRRGKTLSDEKSAATFEHW